MIFVETQNFASLPSLPNPYPVHTLTLTPPARERKPTKIVIGESLIDDLASALKTESFDRVVLLYDKGIEAIAQRIQKSLPSCISIPVPPGDASKSLQEVERITALMLDAGCTRNTLLICSGGGMLTDLGGFVAGVFMRGIACVLVPTSLLAVCDAAIGGKTAVNAGGRKNMIGTLSHPESVMIDLELLKKLPQAQFSEGLVEVIKIAAMVDAPFFSWLEENIGEVMKRTSTELSECVSRAIEAKVRIVEQDEHDRDTRLLLNFGHTIGHAVEALSRYKLSHGAAVSIGMIAEMKTLQSKDLKRVSDLLQAIAMPLSILDSMSADALWAVMLSDKKNENGAVRCAVPISIGEGAVKTLTGEQFLTLFP